MTTHTHLSWLLLLLAWPSAPAARGEVLTAFECRVALKGVDVADAAAAQGLYESSECATPLCGRLNVTDDDVPFTARLSPQCAAALEEHRVPSPLPASVRRASERWRMHVQSTGARANGGGTADCMSFRESMFASSPVVVQGSDSPNFALCTAPKAGCSLLRALLVILTRHPRPIAWLGNRDHVHLVPYPSLYHFDYPAMLPEAYPLFAVGRSPYTRALSGFLDKMTPSEGHDGHPHDKHTWQHTNRALGLPLDEVHEASAQGYQRFVRLLAASVRAGRPQNGHFVPAAATCRAGVVPYHFALRLEDMARWLPCLEAGLDLDRFTERGWDYARLAYSDWYARDVNAGCFWAPHGVSCADFYNATRGPDGARVPWRGLDGDAAGAATAAGERSAGESARNAHATGAADVWRHYYDAETGRLVEEVFALDFDFWRYPREAF